MNDSTVAEQPAEDSITNDLREAFQEHEQSEGQDEAVIENSQEEFQEDPEVQGLEAQEPDQEPSLSAPDHWSEDHKNIFNALTDLGDAGKNAQDFLIARHKAMEGDYTRKTQEIAQFRNTWSALDEAMQPYMANLQQSGVNPSEYFINLGKADMFLQQDPEAGIRWLAEKYGVNIGGQPGEDQTQSADNKQITELKRQVDDLRRGIDTEKHAQYNQEVNSYIEKIQSFMEATDESGNLSNPFVEDVIDDMVILANAKRSQGKDVDLKDLYEQAVWANPATREKKLTADKQAEQVKRSAEARAKAAKSKKAHKIVDSGGSASNDSDLSLRELLESQFRSSS